MTDIVEKLRERHWRSMTETDGQAKMRRQREREEGADTIIALRAENEKLRAALKMARPFIGWAGYYPTILAEVDAALGEKP